MEYRRLGRTELMVSVVGFGTNELRLVPEKQAIDILLRGFDLGVNIVHTAPDYEGAEDLVAKAVARTDRKIIVASNGYDVHYNSSGRVHHFERLFEDTCARLRTERLDLYGIAAVDDREAFQENVWGSNGMVEFLLRMKEEGRIGSIFCTNHGEPHHMRKLIESGVFDVMMISCNPLGYHLLTLHPPPGRHFENVDSNCREIVPLCREHDVGVMAMMPLAGGLLVNSRAFPRRQSSATLSQLTASDVLRSILQDQNIACVLPGTASMDEADENARAGHQPIVIPAMAQSALTQRITQLLGSVCSRCGACEDLCSQGLPVSWLFRAGEMAMQPAEAFETWSDVDYFRLHPSLDPSCPSCTNVTCACPHGIDIPRCLTETHESMEQLLERGLIAPPPGDSSADRGDATFGARVIVLDIPESMRPGQTHVCRLQLENIGTRGWFPEGETGGVVLSVFLNGVQSARAGFRQVVHPGGRGHIVFELDVPRRVRQIDLRLHLLTAHPDSVANDGFEVFRAHIPVSKTQMAESDGASAGRRRLRATDRRRRLQEARSPAPLVKQDMRAKLPAIVMELRRIVHAPIARTSPWVKPTLEAMAPPRIVRFLRQGILGVAHWRLKEPKKVPEPAVGWIAHNLPSTWTQGEAYYVYLSLENRGKLPWLAQHPQGRHVTLVVWIHGQVVSTVPLPRDVSPGERAILNFWLDLPESSGDWDLNLSLVEQDVGCSELKGASSLLATIRQIAPASPSYQTVTLMRYSNPAFYAPSYSVPRSRSGQPYPLLIRSAAGARIRDPENNVWTDYVMGWGSALLGYAHPEISRSIADHLQCGAVLSLPHELEAKVTQRLIELIPCAELVLFGKNGSDVCNAAVRAARLATGRRVVLFSGYHGWSDPFAEVFEPALAPPDGLKEVFRFGPADLDGLSRLVSEHSGRIAAVMLEPAAQVEGVDGPVREADPDFLRKVSEICRGQSAVLIFDEIMTGFRYRCGSVQQATGIIPDLACFGKALSSGMPLSALVGRRDVLAPVLSRMFYHPTFKGEVYSFAAALSALDIYQREDVPARVQKFGDRLIEGVNRISEELGIDGRMVGLPHRMVFKFNETQEDRRACLRTLLQQELLQRRVLTFRGFMLPSLAHGEQELEETLVSFRAALTRVRQVAAEGSFVSCLEIPLIV